VSGALGPYFISPTRWQFAINTTITIVTFLIVFLIQNSQNRDNAAIQAKLDEIVRAGAAKSFFIGIEKPSEEEIGRLRDLCVSQAQAADAESLAFFRVLEFLRIPRIVLQDSRVVVILEGQGRVPGNGVARAEQAARDARFL
jgi:low affinity Fe/Cu permease